MLDIKGKILVAKVNANICCQFTVVNESKEKCYEIECLTVQLFNWIANKTTLDKKCKKKAKDILNCILPSVTLLNDKFMSPGSKEILNYEDKLPESWLHTFKGKLVHFKTKACIKIVTRSFEIQKTWINIPVTPSKSDYFAVILDNGSSDYLKRTNPFLPSASSNCLENRLIQVPKVTDNGFQGRISDANGEIGILTLQKCHILAGSSILGHIDFTGAPSKSRICCQFFTALVSVERKDDSEFTTIQAHTQEMCYGTDAVAFTLDIPTSANCSFNNQFVEFSWKLKFEFVLTNAYAKHFQGQYWRAPGKMLVKSVKWEIPIFIH